LIDKSKRVTAKLSRHQILGESWAQ